jgi:DNA-binding transcriptional LysR family regulator
MELSDLKIFCTVVEAGGVTRAAERLHRVPSNVTTRIRQLEDELGTSLFTREGRQLILSPAGQTLLGYAKQLSALAEAARDALDTTEPRGCLRLGSMEAAAAVRLPTPLARYHARHPEVQLELSTGPTAQLIARLLAGEIEAAIAADVEADPRLETTSAFTENLLLVAAAGHPPIRTPADVPQASLLAFPAGCAYRQRLEAWFGAQGVRPARIVELGSYHAMLGCAVAGMGVALIPESLLATFSGRAGLSEHRLAGITGRSETVLAWRAGTQSPRVKALIDLLQSP